jgi:thiosulfate reductase cytochrome b subunit
MRTHSYCIRLAHWLAMAVIAVMTLSGIEIFRAFPSFSSKLPEPVTIPVPPKIGLGGWLGGALKWHLAFAWLWSLTALLSVMDLARGGWRRIRISREELAGVLPMVLITSFADLNWSYTNCITRCRRRHTFRLTALGYSRL